MRVLQGNKGWPTPRVKLAVKGPGTDIRPRGLVAQLNPWRPAIWPDPPQHGNPVSLIANHQSPSSPPTLLQRGRHRCGSTRGHPRVIESVISWAGGPRAEAGCGWITQPIRRCEGLVLVFFDPSFFLLLHTRDPAPCWRRPLTVFRLHSFKPRTVGSSTKPHLLQFAVSVRSETSPLRPSLRFAIKVPDIFPLALPPVMHIGGYKIFCDASLISQSLLQSVPNTPRATEIAEFGNYRGSRALPYLRNLCIAPQNTKGKEKSL